MFLLCTEALCLSDNGSNGPSCKVLEEDAIGEMQNPLPAMSFTFVIN